jgi:D-alanyl-D-alanine carboxypeptidase (penicillin-binding protein 5/6)
MQKRKKPAKPPFKLPSPLVTTFLIVSLLAVAIIIGQFLKGDKARNIMGLFETDTPEYNTDATAELVNPITGMVYAKFDDNTKTLNIDSANGILIDLNTNKVVAHKGGNARIYPASMTKIMTLIVAYENSPDLNATFTMTQEICDAAYIAGASVAGFMPGEKIPVIDLLYGTALPSGADATSGLAEMIAGSEEAFSKLMNDKVKQLGLENTHFVTASGLHDNDHYSTCHDMAKILEYAISIPKLREILSTYTYTTKPTPQHSEGIMLFNTMNTSMNNAGISTDAGNVCVQGGKTGFTNEAHYCLASFAAYCEKENAADAKPQFILVTAGGIGANAHVIDTVKVYKAYT